MNEANNEKQRNALQVLGCDMDGTLCTGDCYTPEEAEKAVPRNDIIDKINELSKHNFIVIWTARRDFMIPATLKWLRKNGVTFHAISNNKTPFDCFCDDRAIRPNELDKLIKGEKEV
jgi:uncharacterized HAD superfamily protein